MTFKQYVTVTESEENITPEQENFTYQDIIEIVNTLEQDELDKLGEFLVDLVYDEEYDIDDLSENIQEFEINEKKYFGTRKNQVYRNKKVNKAAKRKQAKERKKWYKKNKAKVKIKNKLYRKKAKRQPNQVTRHR